MLPIDNDIRNMVLIQDGNVVISASAGTGKTHTTILRIKRDLENNKGYKTFAAITFTKKAAKEISCRLGPQRSDGFVDTNDNFVLNEVIRPFLYDAFGAEYKIEIKPDYDPSSFIGNCKSGLLKIKETGYMCSFRDKHKNFAFKLALEVLKRSHSARRYIVAKYYRIYMDEYQDSDVDMHNFFMYLTDVLHIPLFIVGDEKQSIYGWRGAYCEGFTSLYTKEGFKKFELRHNFRSNTGIQNYSNIFMPTVRHYYRTDIFNDEVILYRYSDIVDACTYIVDWILPDEKCTVLNYKREVADEWSSALKMKDLDFIYIPASPIEDTRLDSEHVWIARGIASYCHKQRYSEYDFRDEIPVPESIKISTLRGLLEQIKKCLIDIISFKEACVSLYSYLGFSDVTEKIKMEIDETYKTVSNDQYASFYNQDSYLFTSGTIHSSKGLEFNQVIINAADYNFASSGAEFLHYVAVTRAEKRLLILAGNDYVFDRYKRYLQNAIEATFALGINIKTEDVIKFD